MAHAAGGADGFSVFSMITQGKTLLFRLTTRLARMAPIHWFKPVRG
jgi:hypothetical protein